MNNKKCKIVTSVADLIKPKKKQYETETSSTFIADLIKSKKKETSFSAVNDLIKSPKKNLYKTSETSVTSVTDLIDLIKPKKRYSLQGCWSWLSHSGKTFE